MTIAIRGAVERLIDAQSSRRPLAPLSETHGEFTLEHAYAIQAALRAELERRGQKPIGWKLGATSPSGQAVMRVKEPAGGFLMSVSMPAVQRSQLASSSILEWKRRWRSRCARGSWAPA